MDLNQQYKRHQLSLMRAGAAASTAARLTHSSEAAGIARGIESFQHALGAVAAQGWRVEIAR